MTPAQHAATIREALHRHSEWDGLAALDALQVQAEQLLRNVQDEAVQTIQAKEFGSEQFARAEAAEARLGEAQAERDRLLGEREELLDLHGAKIGWDGATTEWQRRAEAAEAERDRLAARVSELEGTLAYYVARAALE